MFARRHPVLFFCLAMTVVVTLGFVLVMGMIMGAVESVGGSLGPVHSQDGPGNIGIVEVTGPILSSRKILEELGQFRRNNQIKAIVVRIDSPGGGIGPSQEIYRELVKIGKEKLVLASMGSVAASGGYYIASAAQAIMANPGTITGSIGVIMEYANLSDIIKKIGILPVVIKSGEFKDMGSPLRELTKAEKKMFQGLVDELHKQFVTDAAAGRNMSFEQMSALADGRVYTGQTAFSLKLIDRMGNLDDAVQWAGELAKIQGKLIPVYPRKNKMDFFRQLADTLLKDLHISGSITDHLGFVIK